MKATLVNTLFYFFYIASITAQKDQIYPEEGGDHQSQQHFEPSLENDYSNDNEFVVGRSENSECGQQTGHSIHHQDPCDDNVISKGINNSDSISTRYEPVTEVPSEKNEAPSEKNAAPSEIDEAPSETNEAPSKTDEAPSKTDEAPSETNEAPSETNEAPSETNEAPSETNEAPSETDEAPSETNDSSMGPCVSSDGTFGNISDATAKMNVPITYIYEMQTVTGTDQQTIRDKVLPRLEKSIVDSILHEVFPETCATTAIGKRKQKRKLSSRLLEVVGVSMYPPDYVTTSSCNVLSSSDLTSECYVLKGELTVFLDEDQILRQRSNVENLIEESMNSGLYNFASEEIVQLHYLEKRDPTESNTIDGSDGQGQVVEKRNNRSLRMGLFVGIGTLAAVLAGVVFRVTRRMRNNDDQTELQASGVQTYLDVEEQRRPSFS